MPSVLPKEYMYNAGVPYIHNRVNNFKNSVKKNKVTNEFKKLIEVVKKDSVRKINVYKKRAEQKEKEVVDNINATADTKITKEKFLDSFYETSKEQEFKAFSELKKQYRFSESPPTQADFDSAVRNISDAVNQIAKSRTLYEEYQKKVLQKPGGSKAAYNRYRSSLAKIITLTRKVKGMESYTKEQWGSFVRDMAMPTGWIFEPLANKYVVAALEKSLPKGTFNVETIGDKMSSKTTADLKIILGGQKYGVDVKSSTVGDYKNTRTYAVDNLRISRTKNPAVKYAYTNYYYIKARGLSMPGSLGISKAVQRLVAIEVISQSIVGEAYEADSADEILVVFPNRVEYISTLYGRAIKNIRNAGMSSNKLGYFNFDRLSKDLESQLSGNVQSFKKLLEMKLDAIPENVRGGRGYHHIATDSKVRKTMQNLYGFSRKAKVKFKMGLTDLWNK